METQQKGQFVVAVVDDERALREALESLLKSAGYQIRTYSSAEEFLRYELFEDVACLVLDLRLQGIDGLALQQRMSEKRMRVPIVMITAKSDTRGQLQSQALHSGAVAFLHKPFGDEELLNAVKRACERHRQ
jgi:FixJ family two-component response regulator